MLRCLLRSTGEDPLRRPARVGAKVERHEPSSVDEWRKTA